MMLLCGDSSEFYSTGCSLQPCLGLYNITDIRSCLIILVNSFIFYCVVFCFIVRRWPTDVPCLLLFLVFLGLMLAVGIYCKSKYSMFYMLTSLLISVAWVEGHPQRLINPVDSKGETVNVTGFSKRYLFTHFTCQQTK